MNNEDLLTTNGINDKNLGFTEYTQALNNADRMYDNDKPEFFRNEAGEINFSNISDSSIGYEQFKNLESSSSKKRKKIVRNVINIDSKNRKKQYTFNQINIELETQKEYNYVFQRNKDTFYIICKNTSVSDINDYRELILKNVGDDITTGVGVNKSLFEFDKNEGKPILFVKNFIFNNKPSGTPGFKNPYDNSNLTNYFNTSTNKYDFNILEVSLPSKINKNEVNDYSSKSNITSSFITNVNISYTSPSHYKVSLNKTYSNIYAVRLVSSEIPNTAYSFNGIEITTNLGKNILSTKINNRLKWINLSDKYTFCTYDINEYKLYAQNYPIADAIENQSVIQENQNEILKRSFNVNIHPLNIYVYAYEHLNIKKINTKFSTNKGYFTYDPNKNSNIYYLNNYLEYEETTNQFIDAKDYKSFSSYIINTYYLDNSQTIDNLLINKDDENKETYENRELYLNGSVPIILSQQDDLSENNLYYTDTHQLTAFYIINSGSSYPTDSNGNIDNDYIPKFYKYNNKFNKYELFNSATNSEGNNINIDENLQLVTETNGTGVKITNIIPKTNLYFKEDLDLNTSYYKKYFYGNRGTIYNTSYIDDTIPKSLKNDKRYYNIHSYTYTNKDGTEFQIVDENGKIKFEEILAAFNNSNAALAITNNDINNIFKKVTNTFGSDDQDINYFKFKNDYSNSTTNLEQEDTIYTNPLKIPLVFDNYDRVNNKNYYLNFENTDNIQDVFNGLKQRMLDNATGSIKNKIQDKVYDSTSTDSENMLKLYEKLDKITITLSSVNSTNIYTKAFIEGIESGEYSDDFNDHIKIKNIDYINGEPKFLHIEGDICTIELIYKLEDGTTDKKQIRLLIDVYLDDDMLKYNLDTKNILKTKVCLGSKLSSVINTSNEISRIKNINSSYYKFAYIEDDYKYIYRVLYGIKGANRYYEITKQDECYKFIPIDIISNFRRFVPYIRQNKLTLNSEFPIEERDYFNNFDLIGQPNKYGLDQTNLQILNKTCSLLLNNIYSQVKYSLDTFKIIEAVTKSNYDTNDSFIYFSFTDNFQLVMSFFSSKNSDGSASDFYDDELIYNLFHNCQLPIKISLVSLNDVLIYNYYITQINNVNITNTNGRLKASYKFTLQPIDGDFSNLFEYTPFKTSTKSSKVLMIVYNPINVDSINLMKSYHPDYLDFFTKYYSTYEYDIYEDIYDKNNNSTKEGDLVNNNTPNQIYPSNVIAYETSSSDTLYNTIDNYLSNPQFYLNLDPIYSILIQEDSDFNKLYFESNYTKLTFELKKNIDLFNQSYLDKFTHLEIKTNSYKLMFPFNKNIINGGTINNIFEQDNKFVTIYLDKIKEITTGSYDLINQVTINFHIYSNNRIQKLEFYDTNSLEKYKHFSKKILKINSTIMKNNNDHYLSKYNFSMFIGDYTIINKTISFDANYKKLYNDDNSSILDLLNATNTKFVFRTYKFIVRLYQRPNIDLLLNVKLTNKNKDNLNKIVLPIVNIYNENDEEINETILSYVQYLENNLQNKNIKNNFLDINDYNHYMFTSKDYTNDGIIQEGLYSNSVKGEPLRNITMWSRITNDSSIITGYQPIGFEPVSSKIGLWNLESYPIYQLQIDNGKYNETNFKKYFLEKLNTINQKVYDYKKGIFNEDINKNVNRELLNITKYNNSTTFSIEFNRSIGSVIIKQFAKIFEVNRDNNDIDSKIIYYNNSFPYLYINVPEISLPNNSIAFISGTSSLDNIPSQEINGSRKIIIPNKYRICIRQLAPLPDPSYLDSDKYLFQNKGFVKEQSDYINNEYQDYINNAVNPKLNSSKEYIISKIKRIKQQLIDSNYFGIENITLISQKFDILEKNINSVNQHKFNLKKSYLNNKGKNTYFEESANYDNLGSVSNVYSNNNPFEYKNQMLLNTQSNGVIYNSTEFVEDNLNLSGIQSAFFKGELIMKVNDINNSYNKTITGRITKIDNIADENGNHKVDYDLFCEEANNFRIGDVVMGLDSGAIAVIIPNDYRFNSLPNDDIITLGMGNYILNLHSANRNIILNYFLAVNNSITNKREIALDFINQYNFWFPERLHTTEGFYIKLDTVPNVSRLTGITTSNLQVYIPSNFKFLEGDDTPLSSFGFVDSDINNQFNYFKDNFTNTFDTEIKWSYIINNNIDSKQYLILETKNIDQFEIQDDVFIRNHTIVNSDVDYRKELFFSTKAILSFEMYLAKFESIYNKLLLENFQNSYFVNVTRSVKFDLLGSNIISTDYSKNKDTYFLDDKSSIDSNYIECDITDQSNNNIGNVGLLYYINDIGDLTDLYITDISNDNLLNRDNIVIKSNDITINLLDLKPLVNTLDKITNKPNEYDILIKNTDTTVNIDLEKIPFKNKYICSNFYQNYNEYDQEYTLLYTDSNSTFDSNKGKYFKIMFEDVTNKNNIEGLNIYTSSTNVENLLDKFIDSDTNGNKFIKSQYRNQLVELILTDENDIDIVFVLKEIYSKKDNGVYKNVVSFVKPGNKYYNDFAFVNNSRYNIGIYIKRTFTTFSTYDDIVDIDNVNNGLNEYEVLVAGFNIDSIESDNVQSLISVNGNNIFHNVDDTTSKINISNAFLSDIDNISFAGYNNQDNVDIFRLNNWERYEGEEIYKYNYEFLDDDDTPSKYYYKFDISLDTKNLNLNYNSDQFIIKSGSEQKTIPVNKYIVRKKYKEVTKTNIEPLSIFYRLIQSYISNTYTKDLFKLLDLNSKYSQNLYSSRIIKIKVCPIDNKGFSFEPRILDYFKNFNKNVIDNPVRAVPGYNKKLFPYHEYSIVKNYSSNLDGANLDVNSKVVKRFNRVKQQLDNKTYTSRNFLKGMGLYAIKEKIYPTHVIGSTETSDPENIPVQLDTGEPVEIETKLINTVYEYNSSFVGYVLNTSIESNNENSQSYRLNSDNFSKIDGEGTHSEYYLYVLLDPSITSIDAMDKLFNILNEDYVHYVFDGNCKTNYKKENPITSPGILSNGDEYNVEYSDEDNKFVLKDNKFILNDIVTTNKTIVSPNITTVVNPKNIYGNLIYKNEAGKIAMFDSYSRNTLLDQITNSNPDIVPDSRNNISTSRKNTYPYIDVLQENILGSIVIIKDRLDNTLPRYYYDNRIACATQVERPVFYKKSNNTMAKRYQNSIKDRLSYNQKLFVDGSLDLYFHDVLKNKIVLKYDPIVDPNDFKSINQKNIIMEDKINLNNPINNSKECNIHSNTLKDYDSRELKYSYDKVESEKTGGVASEYTFEPNTDLILINNRKKTYNYGTGPDYNNYQGTSSLSSNEEFNTSGIEKNPIKILSGRILPSVDFKSVKLSLCKEYTNLSKNWCLLDKDYNSELNLVSSNGTYGKYKTTAYDIVGNNSTLYDKDSDNDNIYCEIRNVLEIGNEYIDDKPYGYIIANYDSLSLLEKLSNGKYIEEVLEGTNYKIKILEDKLLILSGYVQDKENRTPFNIPHNTEISIIKEVIVYGEEQSFNINILDENYLEKSKSHSYTDKVVLIRFKNSIKGAHLTTEESEEQSKYYITYQYFKTKNEIIMLTKEEKNNLYLENRKKLEPYINTDIYKVSLTSSNIKYLGLFDSKSQKDYEFINKYIDNEENFIFDIGNKRRVENIITNNSPYNLNSNYEEKATSGFLKSIVIKFKHNDEYLDSVETFKQSDINNGIYNNKEVTEIEVYISNNITNVIPIIYPKNTNVVLLKNTLIRNTSINDDTSNYFSYKDKLPYNTLSTQPFIYNNQWYTKIYFRSPYNNIDKYKNSLGKPKSIINNLSDEENISSSTNVYKTPKIYVSKMKGINIPFICLDIDDDNNINNKYDESLIMGPLENGTYLTQAKNSIADYNINKIIKGYSEFGGKFVRKLNSLLVGNVYTWNNIDDFKNINLDHFIVKGIHTGFGGYCEERYEDELISTVINNDIPGRIARIKSINNKFFMFIELDTYKHPLSFVSDINVENTNYVNQSGRSDSLNYSILLSLLENNLTYTSKISNVQNRLSLFGKSGLVSKKKINNPYNLNQNNYVYLVIPVFDNIDLVQNNSLQGAFAKILLPGESNKTLFNTYTSASKVFTDNLYNNLSELEIAFVTNDGYLFDFNGAEHSFSLEITEIIDKFEHINPKFGNIEF